MSRREGMQVPAVGGSSLLAIFAILCLTVFALLSLSTAQAETRLAEASLRGVTGYYAADCEAELIFARLRGGQIPPQVRVEGEIYSYSCAISEGQELRVEMCGGEEWSVLRWQAVSTAEPEADTTMAVWSGE